MLLPSIFTFWIILCAFSFVVFCVTYADFPSWCDLGLQGSSEVMVNISYFSSSPSSYGYSLIPMRPPLSISGHLTSSDTYKIWVPLFPLAVRCLLATEFTTLPCSLTWYSDINCLNWSEIVKDTVQVCWPFWHSGM